ncbi:MAG: InlB B-repeat-containing protein [Firmicutes bacterium]|nr:InlB B-repeat-containing protein [Bacillota bacterium]
MKKRALRLMALLVAVFMAASFVIACRDPYDPGNGPDPTDPTYTITYVLPSGATNHAENPATFTGADIDESDYPIALLPATRPGYTFNGWYTNPQFTGSSIGFITQRGNIRLYARFTAINYTINFHLPENMTNVTNPNQTSFMAANLPVTLQNASREGFNFLGWYNNEEFTGTPTTQITTIGTANLWGRFEIITSTLTFNFGTLTNVTNPNPSSFNINNLPFNLANPTRLGYLFRGWFDNAQFSGTPITQITALGNRTLYARFEQADNYTALFSMPGGALNPNNNEQFTEDDVPFYLNPAYLHGHDFIGWFDNPEFTGTPVTQITVADHFEVFGLFNPTPFNLTFNGVIASEHNNPATFTINNLPLTLLNATREAATFHGWFDNPEFTGDAITQITEIGHVVLFARFTSGVVLEDLPTGLEFSHFPQTRLQDSNVFDRNNAPTIYVLNRGRELNDDDGATHTALSARNLLTANVIQGLFARDNVRFFVDAGGGVANDYHLDFHSEAYGIDFVNISLERMIEMYVDSWAAMRARNVDVNGTTLPMWGSNIPASNFVVVQGVLRRYASSLEFRNNNSGYANPGLILYREGTLQTNIAATLAGITGFLPVAHPEPGAGYDAQQAWINSLSSDFGLEVMLDVDLLAFGYNWMLDIVSGELNSSALVHQRHTENDVVEHHARDIGVAFRFLHYYADFAHPPTGNTSPELTLKQRVTDFVDDNAPIYGYTFLEGRDVAFFSRNGQFFVPTDFAQNLSFFAAREFRNDPATGYLWEFGNPESQTERVEAVDGYHYVAFIVSDGDNVGQWQMTYPFGRNLMGAAGREHDSFSVTWGVSPSIVDMMPSVYRNIQQDLATSYDSFIAPVTGQGYANLGRFMLDNRDGFLSYLDAMDVYLRRSGISLVTAMSDGYAGPGGAINTTVRKQTMRYLAQVPSLRGGIMYEGGSYFGSVTGSVYWTTGLNIEGDTVYKPFLGPRDSLWNTNPAFIAGRLNYFARHAAAAANPATRNATNERYLTNSIDSFSLINVHPWSHNYQDMRAIAELTDSNIRFISVDQMIDMVIENITPTGVDNTANNWGARGTETRPAMDGANMTRDWLAERADLVPVNPLFHEFLFTTEGWTSTGGNISHFVATAGGDPSRQEGFTRLATSIQIPRGVTAIQPTFYLPNEDNLFVWFMARGAATATTPEAANANAARMSFYFTVGGQRVRIFEDSLLRATSNHSFSATAAIAGDGWQYFGFPLRQYFENYQGQPAHAEVTALMSGANAVRMTFFRIQSIVATPNGQYDPLNNQFLNHNTEDWALGHMWLNTQFMSFGATWTERGAQAAFPYGSLRIDVSNGGGQEMRGTNSAMFIFKHYTIPAGTTGFTWNVDGGDVAAWGCKYKITLYINNRMVVIQDWTKTFGNAEYENPLWQITRNLSEFGITITENTPVTVMLQARDSGDRVANGAGEKMFFRHWITNVA